MTTLNAFLLTANAFDSGDHYEIELFGKSTDGKAVRILVTDFRPLFFIPHTTPDSMTAMVDERRSLPIRTFNGQAVDCCYFKTASAQRSSAEKLRQQLVQVFESDIHPLDRFLMERSVFGGFEATGSAVMQKNIATMHNPRLRGCDVTVDLSVMSIDIETSVAEGSIYSIACAGTERRVFMIGDLPSDETVIFCKNERDLLTAFLYYLRTGDPDVIIGWNVIDFDIAFIAERTKKLGIPFFAGRYDVRSDAVYSARGSNKTVVRIGGRVVIDVPVMLRSYFHSFEEYSLDFVASEMLGRHKEITATGREKIAEINRMFDQDKMALASYNLQDAVLTKEIFDAAECLPNAVERTKRSGQLLDRGMGSIAAFDYIYLPKIHREGFVAPDAFDSIVNDDPLPGGYVIEPDAGLYENVLVFDFRSLYPSLIMTFGIDPLSLYMKGDDRIQGPCGPSFARKPALLPAIIRELLDARLEAKRRGNQPLQQAIKILMNSFYGVLGARNCRFFNAEIATTITRTGQFILKKSIDYIQTSFSYPVIYGDTDSLFVHLGKGKAAEAADVGKKISTAVTEWLAQLVKKEYSVESALLLQFETHFHHFLIPSVRGAVQGSKKHYCGGIRKEGTVELHFKGMESARTDWTECAKTVQQELIKRVFDGLAVDDYLLEIVSAVRRGELDDKLVYRKRLRKRVEEYTQNIPPHVQAAMLLDDPPHVIRYYITIDGPQPVEKRSAALDYEHYIESQIKPVADSVLELIGSGFDKIVSGQQDLFADL